MNWHRGDGWMDGWSHGQQSRSTGEKSTTSLSRLCLPLLAPLASSQEKLEQSPKRDIEGMGVAEIKYGDSLCFIMHVATGLWLSYQAPDVKSARLGPLKRRVSGSAPTLCRSDVKRRQSDKASLINGSGFAEQIIIFGQMSR